MDFEKIFQEAEKLTQAEKMDAWHDGTRGFNLKAASTDKLRANLDICKEKEYDAEVEKIKAELESRGIKLEESIEEQTEEKETMKNEQTENFIWKVEALGEGEVRELFNNIRYGNSRLDQEFVEKIYKVFPEMPHAVKILRGDVADNDSDSWENFHEELNDIFSGVLYYSNGRYSGLCNIDDLWDHVGDGKNPLDVYVATYSRSDGMENTAVFVYGSDWYKICKITDDVMQALTDNIFDVEGGEEIINKCFYKEFGKPIFLNNKSLI